MKKTKVKENKTNIKNIQKVNQAQYLLFKKAQRDYIEILLKEFNWDLATLQKKTDVEKLSLLSQYGKFQESIRPLFEIGQEILRFAKDNNLPSMKFEKWQTAQAGFNLDFATTTSILYQIKDNIYNSLEIPFDKNIKQWLTQNPKQFDIRLNLEELDLEQISNNFEVMHSANLFYPKCNFVIEDYKGEILYLTASHSQSGFVMTSVHYEEEKIVKEIEGFFLGKTLTANELSLNLFRILRDEILV